MPSGPGDFDGCIWKRASLISSLVKFCFRWAFISIVTLLSIAAMTSLPSVGDQTYFDQDGSLKKGETMTSNLRMPDRDQDSP